MTGSSGQRGETYPRGHCFFRKKDYLLLIEILHDEKENRIFLPHPGLVWAESGFMKSHFVQNPGIPDTRGFLLRLLTFHLIWIQKNPRTNNNSMKLLTDLWY